MAERVSGCSVRDNRADKVDAVDRSSYAIHRSDIALELRNTQGFGARADQDRRAAVLFGRERKCQLDAGSGLKCDGRLEIDSRSRDISQLSGMEFGGPMSRHTDLQR